MWRRTAPKATAAPTTLPSIQKAIDACARSGGGTGFLPAGDFLSGTIVLKSNIVLHLSPGATLRGSRDIADYHPPFPIYAQDAERHHVRRDVHSHSGRSTGEPAAVRPQ